jgi:hypothetical protein
MIPEDLPEPNTKKRRGRPRIAAPPPKQSQFGQIEGFDFAHFREYLNALKISTKEEGFIRLGEHLMGTQKRWLSEVEEGMSRGIREFVTLKARQIGISSISLAMDLYFASRYPGLSGALVLHEDAARAKFRSMLETYYEGLPEEWQKGIVAHNVNQLVLENGATLEYKVAGLKQTSSKTLGRSSALVFGHMTEPAFWGDGSQISALRATFAEHNPVRFYHWESTANGFNHFQRLWQEAKASSTIKAIFISWWANDYYRCKAGSALFERYWGKKGRATPEERDWAREVLELYAVSIEPEQFAWYRYMAAEKITDEMELLQEYPHTENHAFIATGSQFFTAPSLNDAYQRLIHEDKPDTYRIQIGREFTETQVIIVPHKQANLFVWAEPEKGACYVLGADPAYGSTHTSDQFAATVYRAWSNRLEQVAEFTSNSMSTFAFAWVICYLAGAYEPCLVNLEIDGPGEAVLNEMQNLKKSANLSQRLGGDTKILQSVTRAISQYMYRRIDSLGGAPTAIHTQTNTRVKERMFNNFKDNFERGILIPHSRLLVDEMQNIRRYDGDIQPAADHSDQDDRSIATALAALAWNDQLRTRLIGQGMIWTPTVAKSAQLPEYREPVVQRLVRDYMYGLGLTRPASTQKRQVSIGGKEPPPKFGLRAMKS